MSADDFELIDLPLYDAAIVASREIVQEVEKFLATPLDQIQDRDEYLRTCVAIIEGLEQAERNFAVIRIRAEKQCRKLWRQLVRGAQP